MAAFDEMAEQVRPDRDKPMGIHGAFDNQDEHLEMLEQAVERLADRLASILRPDTEPKMAERLLDAVSADSHAQDRINKNTGRVAAIRRRVHEITERIDI